MSYTRKVLLFILIIIITISLIECASTKSDEVLQQVREKNAESTEQIDEEVTYEEEPEPEPEPTQTRYYSGMYKIGTDIPAGEYKLYSNGSGYGYFENDKDSSGSIYSIISNDTISTFTYTTVKSGTYLKLQGCYAVPVKEAEPYQIQNKQYLEGKYKVGFDIPAGEYKLTSYGSDAYVEVSKNSSGSISSIVSNDIFENTKYITVEKGQYLKLSGCYIQK
jgi:hypothetical protein